MLRQKMDTLLPHPNSDAFHRCLACIFIDRVFRPFTKRYFISLLLHANEACCFNLVAHGPTAVGGRAGVVGAGDEEVAPGVEFGIGRHCSVVTFDVFFYVEFGLFDEASWLQVSRLNISTVAEIGNNGGDKFTYRRPFRGGPIAALRRSYVSG